MPAAHSADDWEPLPLPVPMEDGPAPALRRLRKLRSRELQNYRDVLVALPPSYPDGNRRYPVAYMHDGQNLFDPATSYAGDWDLVRGLARLASEGTEVIVVGISNTRGFRRYEYSPFRDPGHGGGDGNRYLDFLTRTVRPLVDAAFRTDSGRTVTAGSSLGGLVSLYALLRHPDIFGAAGALSPSAWFAGEAILDRVAEAPAATGRIYLDVGAGEDPGLVDAVRRLRDRLEERGWTGARIRYHEDPDGTHHESHWGRRFVAALPFLLGEDEGEEEDEA